MKILPKEKDTASFCLTKKQKKEIDKQRLLHQQGKTKSYTLGEAKQLMLARLKNNHL